MQANVYLQRQSPDLGALSWHGAAETLPKLSRDEAVMALARVPVADVAGILTVLLAGQEKLAVSLLAHMNPARVRELVATLKDAQPWLESLPEAAAAIAECERRTRDSLGERTSQIERFVPSPRQTDGYRQRHRHGQILWSARGGAHPVPAGYAEAGHYLGSPLTEPRPVGPSPFGTDGTRQLFEGSPKYPGALYASEKHGLHAVYGHVGEYYDSREGPAGPLGFPTGRRMSAHDGLGMQQDFEGGAIYFRVDPGGSIVSIAAIGVLGGIADYHREAGGVAGRLGLPVRDAVDVVSRYGTSGQCQLFDGEAPMGDANAAVYTTQHGTFSLGHEVLWTYRQLGAEQGLLGLPTSDAKIWRTRQGELRGHQGFEGGALFFHAGGCHAVRKIVSDLLLDDSVLMRQVGFPAEEERRVGDREDDIVQTFEYGMVTVRDGRVRAWKPLTMS